MGVPREVTRPLPGAVPFRVMPPAVAFLRERIVGADVGRAGMIALLAAIHLSALGILIWSEEAPDARLAFILAWVGTNLFWLALLRRPLASGTLSLAMLVLLILLSQFKHATVMMTATFVDLMIIDTATVPFLFSVMPGLAWRVALAAAFAFVVFATLWHFDPFRARRRHAAAGSGMCLGALVALSLALPVDREEQFQPREYVSKFVRSASVAAVDLATRGVLEADASIPERLPAGGACGADTKRPHILLVFDESSFDATMLPGVKVPPGYRERFRSYDGKQRSLLVEGAGGPSWYTEYNVLTGLSVRSYGRFSESVTLLATGKVNRGLPRTLQGCGYKTISLYSWFGEFVGARGFQTTTGIQDFRDAEQLHAESNEPDSFYYDHAVRTIAQERRNGPLFVFVYLAANHFAWDYRYHPELLPDWSNAGNIPEIDEYLRRQQMSVHDLAQFKERLAREFPDESFLLVRFGDHQPLFAKEHLEPELDQAQIATRILDYDPRYFTTYYAIEGVNFRPKESSAALDTLDAPFLPLVVLEAAGLPLDASFAEQKRILERCKGLFYPCADGAEARRFNRLLIDAGLIHGF
jgi:hypothetical protein